MNAYLTGRYGDPCRICGFEWNGVNRPGALIDSASGRYRALTEGRDGREEVPELTWNLVAYVCHVADNTKIWAERLASAAFGASGAIASYDEDALAVARSYRAIALPAALWSLERSLGDWAAAKALGGTGILHPEQGELSVDAVELIVAHEIDHHAHDIQAILDRA